MMAKKKTNPDFLNGVPELLILQLLDREPMYGYQIVEAIRIQSEEVLEFGEGSIYPVLHRLEAAKLLGSKRQQVNGRQRVVYHTTSAGKKRLSASVDRWRSITESITVMLEGVSNAKPRVA